MRYGIMHKQGDILLIPVPFTDLTSSRKRPVLVMSNDQYNNKTEDIIVIAITSNLITKDYSILIKDTDLTKGNLKVDSCIRVDKIYTLSQDIIIRKFGEVSNDIMSAVTNNINKIISCQKA